MASRAVLLLFLALTGCHAAKPAKTGTIAILGRFARPGIYTYTNTPALTSAALMALAGGSIEDPQRYVPLIWYREAAGGTSSKRFVRSDDWNTPLIRLGIDIEKCRMLENSMSGW